MVWTLWNAAGPFRLFDTWAEAYREAVSLARAWGQAVDIVAGCDVVLTVTG